MAGEGGVPDTRRRRGFDRSREVRKENRRMTFLDTIALELEHMEADGMAPICEKCAEHDHFVAVASPAEQ